MYVLKIAGPQDSPFDAVDSFLEYLSFIHTAVCFNYILASLVDLMFSVFILMSYNQSWQNQEAEEVRKPAASSK